jgi:hypothetical protein
VDAEQRSRLHRPCAISAAAATIHAQTFEHHDMSHHPHHHDRSASRAGSCLGAAWIDSGAGTGLIVVDSNRPATRAGRALGLPMQFVAAHL